MIREELAQLPPEQRSKHWAREMERHLDIGYGSQLLREPASAREVQRALFEGNMEEYLLHAYTVMPTHVHVLCTPMPEFSLAKVVQRMKGRSSRYVNKVNDRSGQLWDIEPFDRYMRSEGHFHRTLQYIEWNAVKAKLCQDPTLWNYSSANPLNRQRLEEACNGGAEYPPSTEMAG
jgi:REP element-mobilizing transposase RayT